MTSDDSPLLQEAGIYSSRPIMKAQNRIQRNEIGFSVQPALTQEQEEGRLESLHLYEILDTEPEPAFDDLAALAAQICEAPISAISFIDQNRQWLKARVGWCKDDIPRSISICSRAILQADPLIITDTTKDIRFASNPFVADPPFIRFYAGVPLISREGAALGTLHVMDCIPRNLSTKQADGLRSLARQVMTLLEARRNRAELSRIISNRNRVEQERNHSEALYFSLLNGMPQYMFCKDTDGRYTFGNRRFCEWMGRPLIEILGKTDSDLHTEELAGQYRQDDLTVMSTGHELDVIEKRRNAGGAEPYVHLVRSPIWNRQGKIIGVQGIFWDVSRRVAAEQDLAYERDLLRSLLDNSPDRIYFKDRESRFIKCSKTVVAGLGIDSPEQAVGKTDFDFFTEEHARPAFEDEQRIMRTGEPVIGLVEKETWLDGRLSWAMTTKMPLRGKDGSIIGTFGITKDITDLMAVEAELAYERDLLQALLENSPDRISFKDTSSRFLMCSRALVRRLGFDSPEQVIGKTDFDLHPREKAEEYWKDEQRIIATGQPLINKVERQVGHDGGEIWASVSKVPLFNQEGEITGIIALSRDITALKKAEAELQVARDAALESARLKSEFLANMSHEIRTPMNAIVGMTGILLETPLNEEQRDYAETIRLSTESLLDIINDILDFSKIEAGKLVFDIIEFEVADLVEGTIDLLAARAQCKGLELLFWIHPDVPSRLKGDPGRIRQILANLLSNAVKFTEKGEVVVRVLKERESDETVALRFLVSDTGIGIPEHTIPLMFQAFTQADGSMTRRYGGTGLGLAISKQLVELMHGQIGVESSQGQGSTFWFTIELDNSTKPSVSSAQEREKCRLIGLNVLLVDDNATNRQILRLQLTSWHMRCTEVCGGLEALAVMLRAAEEKNPFDLVLIDQHMPEMDGITLARRIKADLTMPPTRIVMLTSMAHPLSNELLREAGIAACLVKPVKKSRLFDYLSTIVAEMEGAVPNKAARVPSPAQPAVSLPEGRKIIRILVAEDNPINQKVALGQLQKLGLAADAVGNGIEVLEAVQRIPYDLILMDCQMPEMDGYEATRILREREHALDSKPDAGRHYIIAMTAHALQGDREKCLAAGMDDYISKPVQLANLQATIQRSLVHLQSENQALAPAADGTSEPQLDPEVISNLHDLQMPGEPDPVCEIIDLFLEDAPPQIEQLENAVTNGNSPEIHSVAHSLKGSSNNMGARRLGAACLELEQCARSGDLNRSRLLLENIKKEYKRVVPALHAEKLKCQPV